MRKNNCFIRSDGGGNTTAPSTFLKMLLKRIDTKIASRQKARTANTDNMGKLFVTLFAFAPATETNS